MKEAEILELHRLIEEGVHRAQGRLWQRAGMSHQSLVVCRGGKIVEIVPETPENVTDCRNGNPLARRNL